VDAGIAKNSKASTATVTVCLIEPPSVSGKSLSSVIVESDKSELISSSVFFLSSSVTALIFSIILKASFVSSLESDR
jgi:hypothetical protein